MILVSVVFVTSRLAMPIIFNGSYIDEYWHITSGTSLFESANYAYFYNSGGPYNRGLLMSLWVGLWMALFGKSLLVAKLAPISIAIINYFLLLYLSIKLVPKRRFQILLLLLYTLSPWCIFSHFYIRMYIVYEMFLLILLVLGYKMYKAMKNVNWNSAILFLFLITVLNILNLITSNDSGEYLLFFASAVMLASLFIYEFNVAPGVSRGFFKTSAGSIIFSTKTSRAVVVLIISLLAFIALDAVNMIKFLLSAQLEYTSSPEYKYTWFFWKKNAVVTVFFVLAVATFWLRGNGYEKIILPVAGALFFIHIMSSPDLQIIRGVIYFMPLYYLSAVIGVSKVRYPSEWIWYVVISSMLLIATVTNVPRNFYWAPGITTEIHYIEYADLYESVTKNCSGNLIVEAAPSSPFIARFYGVNIDYVLSTATNAEKYDLYSVDTSTAGFKTTWGEVPVLTNLDDLKLLDRDICLIVRGPSQNRFLPSTVQNLLKSVKKSWKFYNIKLYLIGKNSLAANK